MHVTSESHTGEKIADLYPHLRGCYDMVLESMKDIEAIGKAKEGDLDGARELIKQGSDAFVEGHNVHLQLLANDAGGKSVEFSMLLMHAEDQLMGAETFRIVAEDFIDVYERLGK